MKGRPKSFDHQHFLQQSMFLFWKQGHHATSIRDLANQSKLTTGTLYNEFKDKNEIFFSALEYYVNTIILPRVDAFLNIETNNPLKSISDFLISSFHNIPEPFNKHSCFLINTTLEIDLYNADNPVNVLPLINRTLNKIELGFKHQLLQAQELGAIKDTADINAMTVQLRIFQTGLIVSAKTQQQHKPLIAAVKQYIHQLQK